MFRLPYLVCVALFAALVLAKFDPQTGFTSLIRFGASWEERRVPRIDSSRVATAPGSHGYDGQFYAQIALDPLLRDPATANAVDAPAYRARRVVLPGLAYVLGLGQTNAVLQIYALLNVACWFVFAWLLRRELGPSSAQTFARWAACVFSMGVLESVRLSLTDLPAALLLLIAIRAHRTATSGASPTIWLAVGHLTKETNFLGSAALLCAPPARWRGLLWLAASAIPLAIWLVYVRTRLPAATEAGVGNFTWPLAGAFEQLVTSARALSGNHPDSRHALVFLAAIGFVTQGIVLWLRREVANPWWRIGAAYSVLLVLLSEVVWSGYWAVCRVVLPLTLAFNILLPAHRGFWPLWVLGNLTVLHGLWRFL